MIHYPQAKHFVFDISFTTEYKCKQSLRHSSNLYYLYHIIAQRFYSFYYTFQKICEIEAGRGSKCQSHHQSLSVYNYKDWEVTLVSTHDPSWSWTLPQGELHTKVCTMSNSCKFCHHHRVISNV